MFLSQYSSIIIISSSHILRKKINISLVKELSENGSYENKILTRKSQ